MNSWDTRRGTEFMDVVPQHLEQISDQLEEVTARMDDLNRTLSRQNDILEELMSRINK